MTRNAALTQGEVQDLVHTWFRRITDKADLPDMLALLSAEGLEMVFPERTLRSHADFADWYAGVTKLFFDQVHELKFVAVDLDEARAAVTLVVNWQARTWTPPAAYSEWQGAYVHQAWTVQRDPGSGRPVIATYRVGDLQPQRRD
jgi:hypothetical protein